jgi:hypothetical protein
MVLLQKCVYFHACIEAEQSPQSGFGQQIAAIAFKCYSLKHGAREIAPLRSEHLGNAIRDFHSNSHGVLPFIIVLSTFPLSVLD